MRQSRPIYQTRTGASAAALALACEASPTGRARYVPFTGHNLLTMAVQPYEGGPAYVVEPVHEGWLVRELTPPELDARVSAGMRYAAEDLIRRAEAAEARARELLGSKFAPRHQAEASDLRSRAGTLLKVVA